MHSNQVCMEIQLLFSASSRLMVGVDMSSKVMMVNRYYFNDNFAGTLNFSQGKSKAYLRQLYKGQK